MVNWSLSDGVNISIMAYNDKITPSTRVSSTDPKFIKRSGTTDLGKLYEDRFIANLVLDLVANEQVEDFQISSNDWSFGSFDDVVARVKIKNEWSHNLAFQLKHVTNNTKTLNRSQLTAAKGNFSLIQYHNFVKELKSINKNKHLNLDTFKWILFTNCKCSIEEKKIHLQLNSAQAEDFEIIKVNPERVLTKCVRSFNYKFKSQRTTISRDTVKFFDNFLLYVRQPDVNEMRDNIFELLVNNFRCDKDAVERYLKFISDWSMQDGTKVELTKSMMQQAIAVCIMKPSIVTLEAPKVLKTEGLTNLELLRNAILQYNVTLIGTKNIDMLSMIFWGFLEEFKNDTSNIYVAKKIGRTFPVISQDIKQMSDLSSQELSILLWYLDISPLIIEETNANLTAMHFCKNKQWILVSDKDFNRNGLDNISVCENLTDLRMKEPRIYEDIVKTFKCSLQGKKEVYLEEFTSRDEKIEQIISMNELAKMIDEPLVIGEDKEEIPEASISRSLSRHIIKMEFLRRQKRVGTSVIVISCLRDVELIRKYLVGSKIIQLEEENETAPKLDRNHVVVYVSKNECSQNQFRKICDNPPKNNRNCHHFRIYDGQHLEWIRSNFSVIDLEEFRVWHHSVTESELQNYENENNVNVVIAGPGMGKTTLAKCLKNNSPPTSWTLLIYPKDHSHYFSKKECEPGKFKEYIFEEMSRDYNDFTKKALKLFLNSNRVNYIWDGLDEVCEANLETVVSVIDNLSKEDCRHWITSRNNLKTVLEKKFVVLSRTIREFDEEVQKIYVHERLKCSKNDSEEIFKKIIKAIELNRYIQILGIPLEIYMLTELLLQHRQKYETLFNEIFSLTDLYQQFVDQKFYNYFKKIGNIQETNDILCEQNERVKRFQIAEYEKVSVNSFFPSDAVRQLKNIGCQEFLDEIRKTKDGFGIITNVTEENVPTFWHNSYGEYFAASFLVKRNKDISNLAEFIFEERYRNIRFMFDLMLARGCRAHIAVLCRNIDILRKCDITELDQKDNKKRNPLHLACSWGEICPSVPTTQRKFTKWGRKYFAVSDIYLKRNADNPEYRNILNFLLDKCDPNEEDELYSFNSWSYADKARCLLPLEVLSQKYKIPFKNMRHFNDRVSVCYLAAKYDYENIFDSVDKVPLIRTNYPLLQTNFGKNLLTVAEDNGSQNAMKKILVQNAYKDTYNKEHMLMSASEKGFSKVCAHLIAAGANVNAKDRYSPGNSPLHVACKKGQSEIVKLLIRNGANVNSLNDKNQTPLMLSSGDHTEIEKLLLAAGAKPKVFGNGNRSRFRSLSRKAF